MMDFKMKGLSAVILSAGIMVGGVNVASADAIATSYLNVYNLGLFNSVTGDKLQVGTEVEFIGNGVNNTGNTKAELNTLNQTFSKNEPASAAGLDVQMSCVACSIAENSFDYTLLTSSPVASYAVGDSELTGAIVDFPVPTLGYGLTPNANASTLAEVSVVGTGNGTSIGNSSGVAGTLKFIAQSDLTVDFDFSVDGLVRTFIDDDGLAAEAGFSWSIIIQDLTNNDDEFFTSYDIYNTDTNRSADRDLNKTKSSTTAFQDFNYSVTGNYSGTMDLVSGNEYQLTIAHASNATASSVPEPTSLALLGLGLLGFGVAKRRKA